MFGIEAADVGNQSALWLHKKVVSMGVEPMTLALLAPRSNQLS